MISFVVGKNAALYPFIALYLNTASLFLNSRSFSLEVVLSIASKIICSGFVKGVCSFTFANFTPCLARPDILKALSVALSNTSISCFVNLFVLYKFLNKRLLICGAILLLTILGVASPAIVPIAIDWL